MWWNGPRHHAVMKQLEQLNQNLQSMAEKLDEPRVNIHVDSVRVEKANLDKLLFQLERLSIQDLSGSLNLGNNFGQSPQNQRVLKQRAGPFSGTTSESGSVIPRPPAASGKAGGVDNHQGVVHEPSDVKSEATNEGNDHKDPENGNSTTVDLTQRDQRDTLDDDFPGSVHSTERGYAVVFDNRE